MLAKLCFKALNMIVAKSSEHILKLHITFDYIKQ